MSGVIDKEIRNSEVFQENLTLSIRSGVGVSIVRTSETNRTLGALRDMALVQGRNFQYWNIVNGWRRFPLTEENANTDPNQGGTVVECIPETAAELNAELGKLDGWLHKDNDIENLKYPLNCIYGFVVPKNVFEMPPFIHKIRELASLLPFSQQRVVLVTDQSTQIPDEIESGIDVFDFDPPSYRELYDAYMQLVDGGLYEPGGDTLDQNVNSLMIDDEDGIDSLISAASGMSIIEFENAVVKSLCKHGKKNWKESDNPDVLGDVKQDVMNAKTSIVKRSEVLEIMPPEDMSNVGGLDALKEWVSKRRECFTEDAYNYGVDTPKGIALLGVPGNGKSLAAKAIASELGVPLIKFDVNRVFNRYVGNSETRVRSALKQIEGMSPAVVLLDEVDKTFSEGEGGDSGVAKRILGTLLTWMQETTAPVFMVMTANNVEQMPPELLRKGRLDEIFAVGLPTNEEREDIIKIHLRKRGKDPDEIGDLCESVRASEQYVPAEIESAIKEAVVESYANGKQPLTDEMIAKQFGYIKPISEAFKERFDRMNEWAANNARPASSETTSNRRTQRRNPNQSRLRRQINTSEMDG